MFINKYKNLDIIDGAEILDVDIDLAKKHVSDINFNSTWHNKSFLEDCDDKDIKEDEKIIKDSGNNSYKTIDNTNATNQDDNNDNKNINNYVNLNKVNKEESQLPNQIKVKGRTIDKIPYSSSRKTDSTAIVSKKKDIIINNEKYLLNNSNHLNQDNSDNQSNNKLLNKLLLDKQTKALSNKTNNANITNDKPVILNNRITSKTTDSSIKLLNQLKEKTKVLEEDNKNKQFKIEALEIQVENLSLINKQIECEKNDLILELKAERNELNNSNPISNNSMNPIITNKNKYNKHEK